MRKVVIEFTLTRAEHDLLVAAQSDKPNAERVKLMLLSDAASLLRRMGENVLSEYRQRAVSESRALHEARERAHRDTIDEIEGRNALRVAKVKA